MINNNKVQCNTETFDALCHTCGHSIVIQGCRQVGVCVCVCKVQMPPKRQIC